MLRILSTIVSILVVAGSVAKAEERGGGGPFLPVALLKLDPLLTHHVILVEKHGHQLSVYENRKTHPVLVNTYSVATGKFSGDKRVQGDKKTPEGVYSITDFRSSRDLLEAYGKEGEIYGAGAFVLNYPNPIDVRKGKTGSGIWLHSTNDNSRISAGTDSRGCVVTIDEHLADIARFVELGKTPLIIVENSYFLPQKEWMKRRKELETIIDQWTVAWQQEDFAGYISHYHPQKYRDNFRKSYAEFKSYKRNVFSRPGKPQIGISHVSIIGARDYVVVQFVQNYKSETISDIGKKTLYLEQDHSYKWKIVHETWSSLKKSSEQMAFTPSQRFFNNQQAKN